MSDGPADVAAYAVPRAVADGRAEPRAELVAADPIRRLAAYLIDLGVVVLAVIAAALASYFLAGITNDGDAVTLAGLAVVLLVLLAQWVLSGWRGQTLGKLLCRVRVVQTDGAPAGIVRGVLIRGVAPVALVLVIWWLGARLRLAATPVNLLVVGLLVADKLLVFSADSRRLVDRLAGTRVVAVDPPPRLPRAD